MMATRRREFLAVAARVGFLFAAAGVWSSLTSSEAERESSLAWERKGFEVKKLRLRGRLAGAVKWNDR
jgi:hypothetical protein